MAQTYRSSKGPFKGHFTFHKQTNKQKMNYWNVSSKFLLINIEPIGGNTINQ